MHLLRHCYKCYLIENTSEAILLVSCSLLSSESCTSDPNSDSNTLGGIWNCRSTTSSFSLTFLQSLYSLAPSFFIEIKKGCPQTVTGLSSVDILALILRVFLGLVIVVTLEGSGPVDYIASLFVHKSRISSFNNQVSNEAINSIATGILVS